MSILPGSDRLVQRFLEGNEVVKRAAALLVISPDRCFGKIKIAVTARIVAFVEQSSVLFVGKRRDVQATRGDEADLHFQKHASISPCFSKKICPFMQSHSVNRNRCRHPFSNVSCQTFGSNRPILQSRNFFVEMTMVELLVQRLDTSIDIPLANDRPIGLFFSKSETRPVFVPVNGGGAAEESLILRRCKAGRHRLPRRRKLKPVISFARAVEIKRRAPTRRFDEMTRD